MSKIETFNSAVSDAVNKENTDYKAIFGATEFTPEATIVDSDDYNCGALCNELEFLRTVSNYYVQSFDLDIAEDENLDALIEAFVDIPRRTRAELDSVYRNRFRAVVVEQLNRRRTTRWALLDALRYFITDVTSSVQVVEIFEVTPTYFELRIEGTESFEDALFLNNPDQGYLDNNFVGGVGIGEVISYIGELIDAIKAGGVDYDILFIHQDRLTKTVDMRIGSVQMYKAIIAVVKASSQVTKIVNATIT